MSTKDLQQRVAEFVTARGLDTDVAHRLLDAVSELGEVAKEVLKGCRYGSEKFVATPNWSDELGDIVFSLICLANQTGVDLEQAIEGALLKYEQRLTRGGDAGSGN
jgi:NTP pyrophosphatase (non-canonical NTP hydrolase)